MVIIVPVGNSTLRVKKKDIYIENNFESYGLHALRTILILIN